MGWEKESSLFTFLYHVNFLNYFCNQRKEKGKIMREKYDISKKYVMDVNHPLETPKMNVFIKQQSDTFV